MRKDGVAHTFLPWACHKIFSFRLTITNTIHMKAFPFPPVLPWLLFYCCGLVLASTRLFPFVLFALFVCGLLLVNRWVRKKDRRFVVLCACGLGIMGFVHMNHSLPIAMKRSSSSGTFVGEIVEQVRSSEMWSTSLVHLAAVRSASGTWNAMNHKVLLISENEGNLFRTGDRLLFTGTLSEIRNSGNPGAFNEVNYWRSKGIRYRGFVYSDGLKILSSTGPGYLNQLLSSVRNYVSEVLESYVGGQGGAMTKVLLLGDKNDLSEETRTAFANSGAMHMLAVSGLHVGIIAYLLNLIFGRLFYGIKRRYANLILILLLWFYAFVTGFSPSVTRAVLMFSVLIGAQLTQQKYEPLNALTLAALVLLVYNPLYLYDIGFQLSFLAMIGIFTIYPLIERWWYFRFGWLRKLWQGTAVGLAAQVFTAPLSLYYFHQFPNYFVLTNLGVMALAGLILGTALALIIVGRVPYLNYGLGILVGGLTGALLYFVSGIEQLPGAVAVGYNPSTSWLILMYILLVVTILFGKRRPIFYLLPCLLIVPLQWGRLQNLQLAECVVFNTRHLTILLNDGQQQLCFYGGKAVGLKSAKRLMADYERVHPGRLKFVALDPGTYEATVGNQTVKIIRDLQGCLLTTGTLRLNIITSHRWKATTASGNVINITLPTIQSGDSHVWKLEEGAYRSKLN